MARVRTLRDRVQEIVRRYKFVNAQKFCFNKKSELQKRFKRITCWYLIHDVDRGYSVMKMDFKRVMPMSVDTWARLHRQPVEGYDSLYSIFTQAVLPAINNKGGNKWSFTSLLAWASSDRRSTKNPSASRRGNKTANKRNANARRGNRSRHRNR